MKTWATRIKQVNKGWWIAMTVFAVYVLAGIYIAPSVVSRQLSHVIEQKLHLQANVHEVKINPLKLAVDLRGFTIKDGAQLLVSFDSLVLDLDASSLFRWAVTFDEIRLEHPYVNAELSADGHFNLEKLIPPDDKDKGHIRWLVHQFVLRRGAVDFLDHGRAGAVRTRLEPLMLELQEISSLPDRSGRYELIAHGTGGAEIAWSGELGIKPFKSRGRLKLKNLDIPFLAKLVPANPPFQVSEGKLSVDTEYRVDTGKGPLSFRLEQGNVQLANLKLTTNDRQPFFELPQMELSGLALKWPERQASISQLMLKQGILEVTRSATGQINLSSLLTPHTPAPSTVTAAASRSPWTGTLAELSLEGFHIHLKDQQTQPAFATDLHDLDIKIKGITQDLEQPLDVELETAIGEKGQLSVDGELVPASRRFDGDVSLVQLELLPLQAYIKEFADVTLLGGKLGVAGHMQYTSDAVPQWHFTGKAGVHDFALQDARLNEPLFSYQALDLKDIDASQARLNIREIDGDHLYGRIMIARDKSINLSSLIKSHANGSASPPPAKGPVFPVKIARIALHHSSLAFADMSLNTPFATGIDELDGIISGLNSAESSHANVDLKGRVDRYGQVAISGRLNPLASHLFADIGMHFKDIELTTLTPYSAKFAGYRIDKGKLNLDLHYLIDGRELTADNKVILDQLTLGERVDSPDATNLPLKLALALLRDSHGVINIDLPISGSLDNPDFQYGAVVWHALVNLLSKAATAPFKMLASLVGGDEEQLRSVSFPVGSATLPVDAAGKLSTLAQALEKRPSLYVEVRGLTDADADALALRTRKFLKEWPAHKNGSSDNDQASLERWLSALAGQETVASLRQLAMVPDAHGNSTSALVLNGKDYEQRLRNALIDRTPVDSLELRSLAQDRAHAIKVALIDQMHVDESRVFVLDPDAGKAKDNLIGIPLGINAR